MTNNLRTSAYSPYNITRDTLMLPDIEPKVDEISRCKSTSDLSDVDSRQERLQELVYSVAIPAPVASASSWWASDKGTGPTTMGNISRIWRTTTDAIKDLVTVSNHGATLNRVERVLCSRSKFLTPTVVNNFIEWMQSQVSIPFIYTSYLFVCSSSDVSWDELEGHLRGLRKAYDDNEVNNMTWVIPLTLGQPNSWVSSPNHIVAIIIKDNTLNFFDSVGKTSENLSYGLSHTVRDVLNLCTSIFRPGKDVEVVQNTKVYQWDIHNCGVYVSLFIHHFLMENGNFNLFDKKISGADMHIFRSFILKKIQRTLKVSSEESGTDLDKA